MTQWISTTVDLIRHGEPEGGKRYRGQLDDPLSPKGWQQMRAAVGQHAPWDSIISSPLIRCGAFAEELSQKHHLPLHNEPRLKEIGFGSWEGRTAEELMEEDPERLQNFWRDPIRYAPPGAENLAQFHQRIATAWQDILAQYHGKHILIVGHAGQIRMVLREVLLMPVDQLFRIQVDYASITRIQIDGSGEQALPRLLFHGGSMP
jgi:alpha-ribazole phosphatase